MDAKELEKAISNALQKRDRSKSSPLDLLILAGLAWGIFHLYQTPQPQQSAQSSVDALLETIAYAEGTAGKDGYFVQFTGRKFTDTTQHPQQILCSGSLCSDASGKWQFLSTTWQPLQDKLNLPDFSPKSQRLAAIELLKQRGSLPEIEAGNFDQAIFKSCEEWASLPCFDGDTRGAHDQPVKSIAELRAFYQQQLGTPETKSLFIHPAPGSVFTSGFYPCIGEENCRIHPVWGTKSAHKGADFANGYGSPIHAAASGKVEVLALNCTEGNPRCGDGFGNYMEIVHASGYTTLYAHLKTIHVKDGQQVKQGQLIAEMGSTGASTGPHLHFEVRDPQDRIIDPLKYIPIDTSTEIYGKAD